MISAFVVVLTGAFPLANAKPEIINHAPIQKLRSYPTYLDCTRFVHNSRFLNLYHVGLGGVGEGPE